MITNLSQFKKALTIGSLWKCHNHAMGIDLGVRPVSIKQSNSVAFKTPLGNNQWLGFPKADQCKFQSGHIFIFDRPFNENGCILELEYFPIEESTND